MYGVYNIVYSGFQQRRHHEHCTEWFFDAEMIYSRCREHRHSGTHPTSAAVFVFFSFLIFFKKYFKRDRVDYRIE
jgi:hypothetical protein